jgi:hypothetical protein
MNKQIQLLAEQAGMYVDVKGAPWPRWMGAEDCELAYARFAELIVQECLVVINQSNGVGDDDVIKISQDVKKHFGVEE